MPRSGSQGARPRAPKRNAATPHPAVTAHAGSLGTRPNSPESFATALAFPVDCLEADVRFTPDNEAYLSHDPLPMPLPREVMRLRDLLKLAASRPTVRLNLDLKEYTGVKEMAALVKRSRMSGRVHLTGIGLRTVPWVKANVDGLPYLLNARPGLWHRFTAAGAAAFARAVRATGARGLNAPHASVTPRLARALAAAGLSLSVWTVDREREMRRALDLPADNITTNRIDTLLALRGGRAR